MEARVGISQMEHHPAIALVDILALDARLHPEHSIKARIRMNKLIMDGHYYILNIFLIIG